MDSEPKADLLVTNGYRMVGDCDALVYSDLSRVSAEPLVNLMSFNWLSSCNALYRTASVDLKYFEDSHPYGEWTWLAFKLAIDHKVIISIEAPTFRIHDTVASLSKSDAYFEAYEQLFNRMLGLGPPREVVRLVRQKLGAQYHAYAAASTKKGDRIGALKWHLRSLAMPGGFRYLSFSRHLLSSYP